MVPAGQLLPGAPEVTLVLNSPVAGLLTVTEKASVAPAPSGFESVLPHPSPEGDALGGEQPVQLPRRDLMGRGEPVRSDIVLGPVRTQVRDQPQRQGGVECLAGPVCRTRGALHGAHQPTNQVDGGARQVFGLVRLYPGDVGEAVDELAEHAGEGELGPQPQRHRLTQHLLGQGESLGGSRADGGPLRVRVS